MHERPTIASLMVRAPARLHLGFLDLSGALGRTYGSIGLALDAPATEIRVSPADRNDATGPESDRARKIVERATEALGAKAHYRVEIVSALPAHAGLGSGTQLALAVASAIARLEGLVVSSDRLAEIGGRGARSAIGMAAFESGGFIIDGGRGILDRPPPVLVRCDFPAAWRAILILDPNARGAHGKGEAAAFGALPPFPDAKAGELCRLVLMQLLPGIKENDIAAFGAALTRIQEIVGAHFASAQGGSAWTSPAVGRMAKLLERRGAVGIGQTSWGPTGFAFIPSESAAQRLYQSSVGEATAEGLQMTIARGRNAGARIEPA